MNSIVPIVAISALFLGMLLLRATIGLILNSDSRGSKIQQGPPPRVITLEAKKPRDIDTGNTSKDHQ